MPSRFSCSMVRNLYMGKSAPPTPTRCLTNNDGPGESSFTSRMISGIKGATGISRAVAARISKQRLPRERHHELCRNERMTSNWGSWGCPMVDFNVCGILSKSSLSPPSWAADYLRDTYSTEATEKTRLKCCGHGLPCTLPGQ